MISHTYKNMPPKDLESFSALTTSRLESDEIFSSIKEAALVDLLPAHKAYSDALKDWNKFRGDDRKSLLEQCKEALIKQLYYTSVKVEDLAKGNAELISASGYVLRKTNRAKTGTKKNPIPVTAPANFKVTNVDNKPGFVNLSWLNVKGSRMFGILKRRLGETTWINSDQTSNLSIELSGFEPGTVWEFAICTYGQGEIKSDFTAPFGILIK